MSASPLLNPAFFLTPEGRAHLDANRDRACRACGGTGNDQMLSPTERGDCITEIACERCDGYGTDCLNPRSPFDHRQFAAEWVNGFDDILAATRAAGRDFGHEVEQYRAAVRQDFGCGVETPVGAATLGELLYAAVIDAAIATARARRDAAAEEGDASGAQWDLDAVSELAAARKVA